MERYGPTQKTKLVCDGCPLLRTEDWEFHEENDGIDRGTDASCVGANGRSIASYWHEGFPTPDWCPHHPAAAYQRDSARIDAEVDRILSMSDAEIVAEITARGEDPKAVADHMREVIELAIAKAEGR